jgi:hypothetical protein
MAEEFDRPARPPGELERAGALAAFDQWLPKIDEWEKLASGIVVSGPDDTKTMMLARESRLGLRRVRLEIEATRKELKEESLRRSQAIDGCAKALKDRIEPLEAKLLDAEEFGVRYEAQRKKELASVRLAALLEADPAQSWETMFPGEILGTLPEGAWAMSLDGAKAAFRSRKEAEARAKAEAEAKAKADAEAVEARRAEAERQEQERAERERLQREENARLRKEAAEREAAAKAERDRVERERAAEREEAEAKLKAQRAQLREEEEKRVAAERAKREAAEAQARKEREEKERAEAELRKEREAAEAKLQQEAAEARRAAAAPDREKLLDWALKLDELASRVDRNPRGGMPAMDTPEGQALADKISSAVHAVAIRAQDAAAKLGAA